MLRIAGDDANYQRDSDRDRKCNRETGHIDGCDQQQVREIEDRAANHGQDDVVHVRAVDVVNKAGGIIARAAHSVAEDQRDQENANGIVPVEQLEAIVLHSLVGIGP